MSTRSQVRIVKNGYVLNLYHHCDGYFSSVGKELQEALQCLKNKDCYRLDLEGSAIRQIVEDTSYEPTFFYHGDIEYFYLLDFDNNVFKGWQTPCMRAWNNIVSGEPDWYKKMPNVYEDTVIDLLNDEIKDE